MPGGTRGFELLIPFVIGGLILHGLMWLLAIALPFSYVGLFSDNGLLVWIGGGYLGVFLYLVATDGLRETTIPLIKWSVVVAIIYASRWNKSTVMGPGDLVFQHLPGLTAGSLAGQRGNNPGY